MKKRIFEILICALLVVVIVLQVILLVKLYAPIEGSPNNMENSEDAIDVSVIQFDTPYCTVLFPSEWMDNLKIEEKKELNSYSAIFICELNGKSCELFTATFGVEDPENSIGSIRKNGETVPVAIKMAEIDKSIWTKEELKIVKEMQKGRSKVQKSILSYKEIV